MAKTLKSGYKIPVSSPKIDGSDIKMVTSCLDSGWISSQGGNVAEFESSFSDYMGSKNGVSTNSGTTSLHLALASLKLSSKDEIVMPTFTMIATINSAEYLGIRTKLVDADLDTWTMNLEQIENRISKNTKAIMPVHIYGHPENMKIIMELAEKYGLFVIEDAAEAHGAMVYGKKAGSIGNVGSFSFYANKIMTTGEGGMAITNDDQLADRMAWLRAHAFGRDGKHFWHEELGYGYRMSALQASLGLSQLKRIDQFVEKRRMNARLYNQELQPLADTGLIKLPVEKSWAKNVYWMYSILVKDGLRDDLMKYLSNGGVETRTFFYPVHLQPYYRDRYTNEKFLNAELISKEGVNLPSGNTLEEGDIIYITEKIKAFFKEKGDVLV